MQPPPWKAQEPFSRSVRLGVVANQAETDITVNQILHCQTVVTSATTCVSLAYAVRLRRVQVWFVAPTLASNVSSTVEWNAGSTGFLLDGVSVAATSSSTTEYGHLSTRPPTDSLGGWYQAGPSGATNIIFSMSAPAGAIIQVDYDWVPNFTEASYGTLSTTAGVLGTIGCRAWNANILALPPLNSISI
jgi:hypothetical protein